MATIEITDGARERIIKMMNHCIDIRDNYGQEVGDRASASLMHCLGRVLTNASQVRYEDDLSLLCLWESGLTVGVNFSRSDKRAALDRGLGGHEGFSDQYIDAMPWPGTWSLNS